MSAEAIMRLIARQVPQMARRAVAVPSVRMGTVELTSDPTVTYVEVLVDGDAAAISLLNGTGQPLAAGQRIIALFYPPHGAIVIGLLLPLVALEQIWTATYDVTSSTTVSTDSTSWTLLTPSGLGWAASGGDLVCEVPGQWAIELQAVWASNGNGTHRAASLLDAGAGRQAVTSHAFAAPGGTPTVGYGLAGAGIDVGDYLVDDTLTGSSRQDSGGDLSVRLIARLRLLGPSA